MTLEEWEKDGTLNYSVGREALKDWREQRDKSDAILGRAISRIETLESELQEARDRAKKYAAAYAECEQVRNGLKDGLELEVQNLKFELKKERAARDRLEFEHAQLHERRNKLEFDYVQLKANQDLGQKVVEWDEPNSQYARYNFKGYIHLGKYDLPINDWIEVFVFWNTVPGSEIPSPFVRIKNAFGKNEVSLPISETNGKWRPIG